MHVQLYMENQLYLNQKKKKTKSFFRHGDKPGGGGWGLTFVAE